MAEPTNSEDVWTYQGYRIRPGEFNTAMVHFYRGEMTRSNTWRNRLDSTTNWAVVTTGAFLTFAFGSVNNSHVIILLGFLMVSLFWWIESRRYRYYELWTLRVRLMETEFFASMLTPPFAPHPQWADHVAESLRSPEFPISFLEATGRRLRRNYIWLFMVLGLAWTIKVMLHPSPAYSLRVFYEHARIGFIPGQTVIMLVGGFLLAMLLLAFVTVRLRESPGEVLAHQELLKRSGELLHNLAQVLPDELPFLQRHEQLVIIITGQAEAVSQQLLAFLKRGVTALEGTGMYTGQPRTVLLCAVSPSEVAHLKRLVYNVDEQALVVVNPTEEVWGSSFRAFTPPWQRPKRRKE